LAMPWKPAASSDLQRQNDGLRSELIKLRRELMTKQQYAGRLEVLLRERMNRIDELTAKLEQSQQRVKRLIAENECLVALLAGGPADQSMPA
jgi:septal ring factor EnvC (AmiA/AmiB activator)